LYSTSGGGAGVRRSHVAYDFDAITRADRQDCGKPLHEERIISGSGIVETPLHRSGDGPFGQALEDQIL